MKKRFSEEQIITILKEAEAGVAIKELLAEDKREAGLAVRKRARRTGII